MADSYLSYAASGFAAVALFRSILSATFPLFAPQMFERLSANVAISILPALATGFCIVPKLFTQYGEQIRAKSKFAAYSLQVYEENGVDLRVDTDWCWIDSRLIVHPTKIVETMKEHAVMI